MFENLQILQMAQASARHAGKRQALTARNIANADTPGYRARDIEDFSAQLRDQPTTLRTTRSGHFGAMNGESARRHREFEAPGQVNPNGNSVSLEEEMVRSVAAERQHRRALTVYKHALTVLRASVGGR